MEDFTANIEQMLNEKLALYRRISDLLRQEREFIVNIDVDSLWKTTHEKKVLSGKIYGIRQTILSCLERELGVINLDKTTFSMTYLIRILPISKEQKNRLRQIKLAIDEEKNELKQAGQDNKKYVQEYLMVIDDIMSVAVDGSKHSRYSQTGRMPETKTSNCLFHAEV